MSILSQIEVPKHPQKSRIKIFDFFVHKNCHIYIIKKIRVFCTNIFGAKIFWALLKVRGLLGLTFLLLKIKGWPKDIQGDSKGYVVTQWDTGWLSEIQGDPKRYRVTQRDTGWPKEIQATQWDTGWPKEMHGESKGYRVTKWDTGWPKEVQGDPKIQGDSKGYRVTQWDTV